jgi:hypothetical protein
LRESLVRNLVELTEMPPEELMKRRWQKYLNMGEWRETKVRA